MSVPGWYETLLLSLAAWRLFRLLSEDSILDRPRAWILRLDGWKEGQKLPDGYRAGLGAFVGCPACFGFWVAGGWWVAWQLWPHGTTVAAVPLAVSAAVIAVASLLDSG